MEQNYLGLQGKTFVVELQSMRGSTGYSWCLSGLPEELVLVGTEHIATGQGIAAAIERFYFGVVSAQHLNVEINFILAAPWKLAEVADTFTAKVRIVPSDAADFASYDANTPFINTPFFNGGDAANVNYKYGYPCEAANVNYIYGYPCGAADAVLKYGYPCGAADNTAVKYGYPCGAADNAAVKYGYPCGAADAVMKYGYPCSMADAVMKYGYPCSMADETKDARPYGFVNTGVKYGYPGCM